jgi:hypothetical protein
MPITFYNECEALQLPSGTNGADGLSAVSQVKDSTTTIPVIDSGSLFSPSTLIASAVGAYGNEWLQVGVFFTLPQYGTFEVVAIGTITATETIISYKNRGAAGNLGSGTVVPIGTLIIPSASQGLPGTNGSSVLNGIVAPVSGNGVVGDFFINTATSMLYGPKGAGGWPAGVSLIGSAGPTGTGTSITNNAGAGTSVDLSTGSATIHTMTIAANLLCAADNDVSVLNYLIFTRNLTLSARSATGVVSVDIAGVEATLHPSNTSLATNPLAFQVPSASTIINSGISLRVYIHRRTSTTAIIGVTIIDDFQNSSNSFQSQLSAVAFASSLTINLNIDAFANPGDVAFRVGLANAWIEKYKAS